MEPLVMEHVVVLEPLVMEHLVIEHLVMEPLVMEHLLVVEGCPVWTSPGDPLEPSLVELEGGSDENSGRGVVPVVTSLLRSLASSNGSSLSPNTTAVLLVELVLIVAASIATVLDYLMSPLEYFATYCSKYVLGLPSHCFSLIKFTQPRHNALRT